MEVGLKDRFKAFSANNAQPGWQVDQFPEGGSL